MDPAPLRLYQASAGAGKTYTLAREYLRLALQEPEGWDSILGVTFTRKATSELKDRILRMLAGLASGTQPNAALQRDLTDGVAHDRAKQYGPSAAKDIDLRRDSQLVLQRLLHDYDSLGIQTLDAFFLRIVRAFFFELNRKLPRADRIPATFELELDALMVRAWAEDQLFAALGHDEEITDWLHNRLLSHLDAGEDWRLRSELHTLSSKLFDARFRSEVLPNLPSPSALKEFQGTLDSYLKDSRTELQNQARRVLAILEAAGAHDTDIGNGRTKIGEKLREMSLGNLKALTDTARKFTEKLDYPLALINRNGPSPERARAALADGLGAAYVELVNSLNRHEIPRNAAAHIRNHLGMLPLLGKLEAALTQYRNTWQVLLLQDVGELLASIVRDSPVPFLYEKVGTRYRHFLLDEFQDTSRQQWECLRPLLENSLAEGHRSLVVGDVKQAIYGWRGGEQALMGEVASQFAERLEQESLAVNWRSGGVLVAFANQLFDGMLPLFAPTLTPQEQARFSAAYAPEARHQRVPPDREGLGYVEVRFTAKSKKADPLYESDGGGEEAAEDRGALAAVVALVRQLRGEGFGWQDMALLVRKNEDGRALASALLEAGIPVLSDDALKLMGSARVAHVVQALRWLEDPGDSVAVAYLRWAAARRSGERAAHAVFSVEVSEGVPDVLREAAFRLRRLPLELCLMQLAHILGYSLGDDPFLLRLIEVARSLCRRQPGGGISDLLAVLKSQKDSLGITTEGAADAVRILTLHKAKGLEFPVVILPRADWSLKPTQKDLVWCQPQLAPLHTAPGMLPVPYLKDLAAHPSFSGPLGAKAYDTLVEALNLLYVAVTRAVDRLYMMAPFGQNEPKELSSVAQLLQQIFQRTAQWNFSFAEGGGILRLGDPARGRVPRGEATVAGARLLPRVGQTLPGVQRLVLRRRSEALGQWLTPAPADDPRLEGQRMHELLARVVHAHYLPRVVAAGIAQGLLPRDREASITAKLSELLVHPALAEAFSHQGRIVTERALLVPGGSDLRPDRVVLFPDRTLVVEFKTGDAHPSHRIQLQGYLAACRAAGLPNPNGRLVYLTPVSVTEVID